MVCHPIQMRVEESKLYKCVCSTVILRLYLCECSALRAKEDFLWPFYGKSLYTLFEDNFWHRRFRILGALMSVWERSEEVGWWHSVLIYLNRKPFLLTWCLIWCLYISDWIRKYTRTGTGSISQQIVEENGQTRSGEEVCSEFKSLVFCLCQEIFSSVV